MVEDCVRLHQDTAFLKAELPPSWLLLGGGAPSSSLQPTGVAVGGASVFILDTTLLPALTGGLPPSGGLASSWAPSSQLTGGLTPSGSSWLRHRCSD